MGRLIAQARTDPQVVPLLELPQGITILPSRLLIVPVSGEVLGKNRGGESGMKDERKQKKKNPAGWPEA